MKVTFEVCKIPWRKFKKGFLPQPCSSFFALSPGHLAGPLHSTSTLLLCHKLRCHCNDFFLKNAQLFNKTSCCIATKSRLTFLISARFFFVWKWNVSNSLGFISKNFLDYLNNPPSEDYFDNLKILLDKS